MACVYFGGFRPTRHRRRLAHAMLIDSVEYARRLLA
jgi:hypothetical protein